MTGFYVMRAQTDMKTSNIDLRSEAFSESINVPFFKYLKCTDTAFLQCFNRDKY